MDNAEEAPQPPVSGNHLNVASPSRCWATDVLEHSHWMTSVIAEVWGAESAGYYACRGAGAVQGGAGRCREVQGGAGAVQGGAGVAAPSAPRQA